MCYLRGVYVFHRAEGRATVSRAGFASYTLALVMLTGCALHDEGSAAPTKQVSPYGPVEYIDTLGFMFVNYLEGMQPANVPRGPQAARAHLEYVADTLYILLEGDVGFVPAGGWQAEVCRDAHSYLRALIRSWARRAELIGAWHTGAASWEQVDDEADLGETLWDSFNVRRDRCERAVG